MRKINEGAFRRQLSGDLLALHRVLSEDKSGVVVDVDGLLAAVNEAARSSKLEIWQYCVPNIHLRMGMPQNSLPENCGEFIDVFLNIDIKGCLGDLDCDSITDLVLDIKIIAENGLNFCCWHFDRHIGMEDDGDGEAHPLFHFQHGGHAMTEHAQNLGANLLLPTPRIPFPPMDAILAFDFVLSNFSGLCWRSLRDDPIYCRLLREAQLRHWKPYVEKLTSWWSGSQKDKLCTSLWPHLIA